MNARQIFSLFMDPCSILTAQNLQPDPWQRELLWSRERCLLLNCARQSGKSTVVAALGLHEALVRQRALVLLAAPAERQSQELLRKIMAGYMALGRPASARLCSRNELELANGSRIVALPGREQTIRSFSGVNLLIIDEAARVPDDLYRSVRPMLAVSRGRLLALSTPFGQRGWFYREWHGDGPWRRIEIPWTQCPRISPEFIADEVRAMGESWVDQEYACLFTALEGLVYPAFPLACVPDQPAPEGMQVGGMDFGWRNPFAAIWGVHDRDDVLWITGERYVREALTDDNAAALPKEVTWYVDPSGAKEIVELRNRGLVIRRGDNAIAGGIAEVTARIRTGRLKVLPACKNLIAEAGRYRYPSAGERAVVGEEPIPQHNHALDALRYLVSKLPPR